MKINGIEGLTTTELNNELKQGAKFVVYQYCVSILVMTFKRSSNIYFIKNGENSFSKGIIFSMISLIIGWWGIPWGPIYTIGTLINNCKGGKDVTSAVINSLNNSTQQDKQVG